MKTEELKDLIKETIKANAAVYEIFNNDEICKLFDNRTITRTPWRDRYSQRSLSIECADTKDPKDLIEIFALNGDFNKKFNEAIKGDGQEHKRIRTLHSSALLCLLCFYGISKEKPLELELDNRKVTFSNSRFEVKNEVGKDKDGKSHCSNIDVVLCGVDNSGKKVILFLESKFSEYLKWGKYTDISDDLYGTTYKQLESTFADMRLAYNNRTLCSAKKRYTRHYAGGIKQMISHFIGLKKEIEKGKYSDADIYLGTILYDFEKFPTVDKHKKFEDYTELYGKLAKGLNTLTESKFKVIENCFTYQELFKGYRHLDKNVKIFYSL